MLKKLFNKIKYTKTTTQNKVEPKMELDIKDSFISKDITQNLAKIQSIFKNNSDIIIRQFFVGKNKMKAFIVFVDGLCDKKAINANILGTLMIDLQKISIEYEININSLKETALSINDITTIDTIEEGIDGILNGCTILFLDGNQNALNIHAPAWEHRGVTEPQTENNVRGPHEGFCETLRVNTSLVRRKIKSPDIMFETMKIGSRTRTEVCIVYIKGIANDKIIEEVGRRLKSINIDSILESGYIEELIEDAPLSLFPTVGNTETPDKFAGKILEGRVGILVDGTPMALTVPFLFIESFQTAEDYYSRSFLSLFSRGLRIFSFFLTLFLPAIYVGIQNFHADVLPQTFFQALQVSKIDIPFPAEVESFGMCLLWEILRQSGILMPKPVGQAVSIVGALILGQVAVQAGLISPVMVIVVAATGLLSFLTPPQIESITLLRYPILLMGALFGLFGLMWCFIMMTIHLVSIRSFGEPYVSPLMPFNLMQMKDSMMRLHWRLMKKLPETISWRESDPIADDSMPAVKNQRMGGQN